MAGHLVLLLVVVVQHGRAVLLGVACLHVLGVSDEGFLVRCFCLWGFWTWCIGRGGSGLGVSHLKCF